MNTDDESAPGGSADNLARLLARAGARSAPPAHIEADVRAAVHAEWLHLTQSRKARQRKRWLAAAAILIGVFTGGWLSHSMISRSSDAVAPAVIATLTYTQGGATLNDAVIGNSKLIHAGDQMNTAADGGMRMTLTNGLSMRVAPNSMLHWLDASHVQLTRGGLYVDSHADTAAFIVHTARGDVSHLGTRYLVDADAQSLRVAVRSGRVAIKAGDTELAVDAWQQLQFGADGTVVRSDLLLDDGHWQWADALAAPFVLENRSVAEFLQWAADESGCQLSYENDSIAMLARRTVLHGQQTSLAPLQAVQMILATTDLRAHVDGRLLRITQVR
jgi:ferric-dicitrate binding protein FerR (iron transport regulator)